CLSVPAGWPVGAGPGSSETAPAPTPTVRPVATCGWFRSHWRPGLPPGSAPVRCRGRPGRSAQVCCWAVCCSPECCSPGWWAGADAVRAAWARGWWPPCWSPWWWGWSGRCTRTGCARARWPSWLGSRPWSPPRWSCAETPRCCGRRRLGRRCCWRMRGWRESLVGAVVGGYAPRS
ncbi:MAG: hypothetical protein AVDCRST_MAG61-1560, partial [uncultured Friedmanniella sp.]